MSRRLGLVAGALSISAWRTCMDWLRRQTVGTKLVCGFFLVSLIGAFVGLQGILKAAQLKELASLM